MIITMKAYRLLQLVGLYGMLFLIPLFQNQVNTHEAKEINSKVETVESISHSLFYLVKQLSCQQVGQEHTMYDCSKGIYQDKSIAHSESSERRATTDKRESLSWFWWVYYGFAACSFLGTTIDYRKEYLHEKVNACS